MNPAHAAEEELRNGDPAAALKRLQEQVRTRPDDSKLRVFLFQLLCVLGQWERALNQLEVASGLDDGTLAMAQMYGAAVRCEAMRRDVFDGRRSPMIFGEPDQWLALLIESLPTAGKGDRAGAERVASSRELSRALPPRPERSTIGRSSGLPMRIPASAPCSRRSSTAAT